MIEGDSSCANLRPLMGALIHPGTRSVPSSIASGRHCAELAGSDSPFGRETGKGCRRQTVGSNHREPALADLLTPL